MVLQGMKERRFAGASLASLCGSLGVTGDQNNAELCTQRCVKIYQSLVGDDPQSWDYRLGLAIATSQQGRVVMWWGMRNEEAWRLLSDADRQVEVLLAERPTNRQCQRLHASTLLSLGVLCSWKNDYTESRKLLDRASKIVSSLVEGFPDDRKTLELYSTLLNNDMANRERLGETPSTEDVSTLRSLRIEVLQSMTDRFPAVVEYRLQLVSAVQYSLIAAYAASPEEAYELADQWLPRLLTLHIPEERSRVSVNLAYDIAFVCALAAEYCLERGDHGKAMDALERIPLQVRQPGASPPSDVLHPDATQRSLRSLLFFENAFLCLRQLSVLYGECARQIEADMQLDGGARSERLRVARVRADEHNRATEQALANWSNRLASCPELITSSEILDWCRERMQTAETDGEDAAVPPIERRLRRESELLLCRETIRVGKTRMADNPSMHFLVGYLTAGQEELRDADLAVEMAKEAVSLAPNDEFAQLNLGWALFRAGKWAESLEILADLKEDDPSTRYAITAMNLWHLGRKRGGHPVYERKTRRVAVGACEQERTFAD